MHHHHPSSFSYCARLRASLSTSQSIFNNSPCTSWWVCRVLSPPYHLLWCARVDNVCLRFASAALTPLPTTTRMKMDTFGASTCGTNAPFSRCAVLNANPFSVRKSINVRLRRMTTKRGRETMRETMNRILPELRSMHRMISTEPSVLP